MQKQICFRGFRPPHTVHPRPADSSLPRLPAALSSFSDTPAHNRPPSRTAEPLHQSRRPGLRPPRYLKSESTADRKARQPRSDPPHHPSFGRCRRFPRLQKIQWLPPSIQSRRCGIPYIHPGNPGWWYTDWYPSAYDCDARNAG